MPTDAHAHAGGEHQQNPEVAYERRDLGARGILLFFAVLFISGAAIHLVIWGLYEAFVKVENQRQPEAVNLAPQQSTPRPSLLQNTPAVNMERFPEPRLQSDDATDMDRFAWQESQLLNTSPWRDQAGTVHIPIKDAMRLVAERGLPVRQGSGQETKEPRQ